LQLLYFIHYASYRFTYIKGAYYRSNYEKILIVVDAQTDKVKRVIAANGRESFIRYRQGIGRQENINRLIVTSTVRPSDLKDPGETVIAIEATSGKVLSTHQLSDKPSPSGSTPVEAVFVPHANPPIAYV
jgi:hypothetical protein